MKPCPKQALSKPAKAVYLSCCLSEGTEKGKQWSPGLPPLAPCCCSPSATVHKAVVCLLILWQLQPWSSTCLEHPSCGVAGQSYPVIKAASLTPEEKPVQAAAQAAKGTSLCTLHFPCWAQGNVKVIIFKGIPRMVPYTIWTIAPACNKLQSTRAALLKCKRQEQEVIALAHNQGSHSPTY